MPVTTSYPGVYVEELPSMVHSVTPAPTSVTVFIGYTHPFKTVHANVAEQLFSFADYQAKFGGFFSSPWQQDYVGHAVFQFFLNGGSACYVVGLPAGFYHDAGGANQGAVVAASVAISAPGSKTITVTAKEPVGIPGAHPGDPSIGTPMTVAISNVSKTTNNNDTADIVVTYGNVVETYRKVLVGNLTSALARSALVSVTSDATQYPTAQSYSLAYAAGAVPDPAWNVVNLPDFGAVFADNGSLDKVPVFNLLAVPGIADNAVWAEAVAFCERKRAFFVIDPPAGWTVDALTSTSPPSFTPQPPVTPNSAIYFPWLTTTDPLTGAVIQAPPSGFVTGQFAAEDGARGVWKSPAGLETVLLGTSGVVSTGVMTDMQHGVLNGAAVNVLRQFPGIGTVVYGARTTAATNPALEQWKYVAVRRMALFLEQSLYGSLTWAVFEPNDTPLWHALTQEVSAFMLSLFRQNAFAGTKPSEAFLVQCDATTTTPYDVQQGRVNILVGFAPLKPAEFVVIQIAQLAGQAQT